MKPAINRALITIGLDRESILACQKYPTLAAATGFIEPAVLLKLIVALNIKLGAEIRASLLINVDKLLREKYEMMLPQLLIAELEPFRLYATERSGTQIMQRTARILRDVKDIHMLAQPSIAMYTMLRGYQCLMQPNSSLHLERRYVKLFIMYVDMAVDNVAMPFRSRYKDINLDITRELREFIPYTRIDTIVLNRAAAIAGEKSERSRKRSR